MDECAYIKVGPSSVKEFERTRATVPGLSAGLLLVHEKISGKRDWPTNENVGGYRAQR